MLLLKLLYLILPLIIFCFIMKNSTPPGQGYQEQGYQGHPPPPNKSIPVATYSIRARILSILKPVAILFLQHSPPAPPPKKKTQQIKDPFQGNFASKIDLI